MASVFANYLIIFSFALVGSCIVEGRKDPGEYWLRSAMHRHHHHSSSEIPRKENDCNTLMADDFETVLLQDLAPSREEKQFVKDFEPRPNISVYHNDAKLKGDAKKSFSEDFEPRPNISAYNDGDGVEDEKKPYVKDFEPRPNISIYHD